MRLEGFQSIDPSIDEGPRPLSDPSDTTEEAFLINKYPFLTIALVSVFMAGARKRRT